MSVWVNLLNRATHTGTQLLSTISDAGTAATKDAGTANGEVPVLEDVGGSPGLPAVDGSQLLNLGSGGAHVIGSHTDTNLGAPGAGEDGYVIGWDNGNSEYILQEMTGGGGGGAITGDLPGVQARRTTTYSLPATWADMSFDTTDVENASTYVEHTSADQITLHDTGLYLMQFQFQAQASVDSNNTDIPQARLRIDDTTVIGGSLAGSTVHSDESVPGEITHFVSGSVLYDCQSADEFVSLQTQHLDAFGAGADPVIDTDALFQVIRLGNVGVTVFTDLSDAPSSYSGEANSILRVNEGETALEFAASPVGLTNAGQLSAVHLTASENVTVGDTLILDEQAAPVTPGGLSTQGQIYVKDDTPNTLWFTDDAGTDHQLGVGGGGSGDVVGPASATNRAVALWDGTTGKLLKDSVQLSYGGLQANTLALTGGTGCALALVETGTAPTNTEAYGKLWVKNDAPCTPWFTDDVSSDYQLLGTTGVTAQDAALFTERADHVNAPATGKAEIWVSNDATQKLYFTDDQGTDTDLTAGALDSTAIHKSTADEIHQIPSKTTPVAADEIVIEDSAASWAKKRIALTNLLGGGGGTGDKTLVSNATVDVDASEIVIGGAYIDGSTGGTYAWEMLGTYNDNGGTGNQDIELRLYDRGPDGTPVAGVLRSVLEITSLDTLDRVAITLTASASPGVDTDTIYNTARMYEVRAYLDAGGAVDTSRILSCVFTET